MVVSLQLSEDSILTTVPVIVICCILSCSADSMAHTKQQPRFLCFAALPTKLNLKILTVIKRGMLKKSEVIMHL